MKTWEMMKALQDGHKVTCDAWDNDEYIFIGETGLVQFRACSERAGFNLGDVKPNLVDDWKIYQANGEENDKVKTKMRFYLSRNNYPLLTEGKWISVDCNVSIEAWLPTDQTMEVEVL